MGLQTVAHNLATSAFTFTFQAINGKFIYDALKIRVYCFLLFWKINVLEMMNKVT